MNGNYVIAKQRREEGFDIVFGKVTDEKKGIVTIRVEKDCHIKERWAEVPTKDILLDLGTSPHPGTVYGQDVTSRLLSKREHDFWGRYFWFYRPTKEAGAKIEDGMDYAATLLKKLKLPPLEDTVLELRSPEVKGKWAGLYKHSANSAKVPHRLSLKPEHEGTQTSRIAYIMIHEYAHWFHSNWVTGAKLNARWVRLFNTSIKMQTVTKDDSKNLLELMLAGGEKPSDFRRGLDEEQRNQFNWITRVVRQDHSLSLYELDLLFDADFKDDIREVWPKTTLNKKDLKPVISEYATTNYRETFAEAFAFHVTKTKLPEAVTGLVEKSIEFGRAKSGS